jgi:hypothetical protein
MFRKFLDYLAKNFNRNRSRVSLEEYQREIERGILGNLKDAEDFILSGDFFQARDSLDRARELNYNFFGEFRKHSRHDKRVNYAIWDFAQQFN